MSFILLVACLSLGFCALLMTIRVEALPSIALMAFVLIPFGNLTGSSFTTIVSLSGLILWVWMWRAGYHPWSNECRRGQSGDGLMAACRILAVIIVGWLVVGTLISANTAVSMRYTLAFFVPLSVVIIDRRLSILSWVRMVQAWLAVGGVLALYGVVEFLVGRNPVYAWAYNNAAVGDTVVQHWSVYRITTSLGHPLMNGAFFAVVTAMAVGTILASGVTARRLIGLLFGAVGIILSASRGSAAVTAVAILLMISVSSVKGRQSGKVAKIGGILLGALAVFFVYDLTPLALRSASREAAESSAVRDLSWGETLEILRRTSGLGLGPGSSRMGSSGPRVIVENSLLQIADSTGYVGIVLILSLFILLIARCVRDENYAGLGALMALLGSSMTFAMLESNWYSLTLLALVLLIAIGSNSETVGTMRGLKSGRSHEEIQIESRKQELSSIQ